MLGIGEEDLGALEFQSEAFDEVKVIWEETADEEVIGSNDDDNDYDITQTNRRRITPV